MIRLFISGTDTGVGKTVVSSVLLAAARARGQRVFGFKPAESGCVERDGELHAADAAALAASAGHPIACPYRYRAPLAPAAAAAIEGNPAEIARIEEAWREGCAATDVAIAEGAGGLLVPLSSTALIADLVGVLRCRLVIVARDDLGTINHTLLTLEAAAARALETVAFVFSSTANVEEHRAAENAATIEELSRVPFAGSVPRLARLERPDLEAAATNLRLDLLLGST